MYTYNAVFTCSVMSKRFDKQQTRFLCMSEVRETFFQKSCFSSDFQTDTQNLDFSRPLDFFDRKGFARHPKVMNNFFFSKIFFWKCIYGQVEYGFRHNPMEIVFARRPKKFCARSNKDFLQEKNSFPPKCS